LIEGLDVLLGDALLVLVRIENFGAILRALVVVLAIEGSGIVGDREINLQKLPVGDYRGIIGDLDRLGVPGGAGAHNLIMRGLLLAAGVADRGSGDTLHMLK